MKGAKCVIEQRIKHTFKQITNGLLQQYMYTMPVIDENTQFWGLLRDKKTIQTRGASTYLPKIWEVDKRIIMIYYSQDLEGSLWLRNSEEIHHSDTIQNIDIKVSLL